MACEWLRISMEKYLEKKSRGSSKIKLERRLECGLCAEKFFASVGSQMSPIEKISAGKNTEVNIPAEGSLA
jgi:hypothetical protein